MIAKMLVGRLRRPGGHFIATKFLLLMGPLIPLESMYVVHASSQSDIWSNRITYTYRHLPIQMHLGSVVLGYLRVWLLLLAIAAPFVLMYGEPLDWRRPEMFVSYALLAAWLLALVLPSLVPHRLEGDAAMLAALTGVFVEPERMKPTTRTALRSSLFERAAVRVESPAQVREDARSYDERTRAYVWGACRLLAYDDSSWLELANELRPDGVTSR